MEDKSPGTARHQLIPILALLSILAPVPAGAQSSAPEPYPADQGPILPAACSDGVVLDDGTMETAYGWVPSVIDGRYTQVFRRSDFPSPVLDAVCICWTRTRGDTTVDFEIHVYAGTEESPRGEPVASFPFSAGEVPEFPEGAFYEVSLAAQQVELPSDISHIGVAWDPSIDQFFFVCADHSPATPVNDGHFIDDRADEWGSVLDSADPIFEEHRALLIRARSIDDPTVPVVPGTGLAALFLLLAIIAWGWLGGRAWL